MNMFGKKKNNADASPAPADPPKVKHNNGMPPPPEITPQLDIRPKKGNGGDGKSGTLGGLVGSMMGGGGHQDDDMEEGLLDKKANNNDKKGGNKKQ